MTADDCTTTGPHPPHGVRREGWPDGWCPGITDVAARTCYARMTDDDGSTWRCLRETPCPLHGTTQPAETDVERPDGTDAGNDTDGGAETRTGGHGWDRETIEWLATGLVAFQPGTKLHEAADQVRALLADRDQLNEALGNEADISLKLEQERDEAIADRDAHRAVRRAVSAMLRQATAERDAARAEADQLRRDLSDLRNGTTASGHVYLSGIHVYLRVRPEA